MALFDERQTDGSYLRNHFLQTEDLQRGESGNNAERGTPTGEVSEQSCWEFESTNQVEGACYETVQVSGTRGAFSLGFRSHYFTLPNGKTSVPS